MAALGSTLSTLPVLERGSSSSSGSSGSSANSTAPSTYTNTTTSDPSTTATTLSTLSSSYSSSSFDPSIPRPRASHIISNLRTVKAIGSTAGSIITQHILPNAITFPTAENRYLISDLQRFASTVYDLAGLHMGYAAQDIAEREQEWEVQQEYMRATATPFWNHGHLLRYMYADEAAKEKKEKVAS